MESGQLGRSPEQLTALVGYAAGTRVGPDGKVCYYYADPRVSAGVVHSSCNGVHRHQRATFSFKPLAARPQVCRAAP